MEGLALCKGYDETDQEENGVEDDGSETEHAKGVSDGLGYLC